jgi:hypothetical protein
VVRWPPSLSSQARARITDPVQCSGALRVRPEFVNRDCSCRWSRPPAGLIRTFRRCYRDEVNPRTAARPICFQPSLAHYVQAPCRSDRPGCLGACLRSDSPHCLPRTSWLQVRADALCTPQRVLVKFRSNTAIAIAVCYGRPAGESLDARRGPRAPHLGRGPRVARSKLSRCSSSRGLALRWARCVFRTSGDIQSSRSRSSPVGSLRGQPGGRTRSLRHIRCAVRQLEEETSPRSVFRSITKIHALASGLGVHILPRPSPRRVIARCTRLGRGDDHDGEDPRKGGLGVLSMLATRPSTVAGRGDTFKVGERRIDSRARGAHHGDRDVELEGSGCSGPGDRGIVADRGRPPSARPRNPRRVDLAGRPVGPGGLEVGEC